MNPFHGGNAVEPFLLEAAPFAGEHHVRFLSTHWPERPMFCSKCEFSIGAIAEQTVRNFATEPLLELDSKPVFGCKTLWGLLWVVQFKKGVFVGSTHNLDVATSSGKLLKAGSI
jgi:hypothetical protein